MDEVRIHNFHIYCYLRTDRVHVRIVQSYWGIVEFILSYISRGPLVEREGKRERAIRVTFDKFLRPAVAAWKENKPYPQVSLQHPKG